MCLALNSNKKLQDGQIRIIDFTRWTYFFVFIFFAIFFQKTMFCFGFLIILFGMKTVKKISQHFVQFQFLMTHNNYFTQNLPILDNCNIFKQFTIFWNLIYTFFGKKQELTSPLY